MTKHSAAKASKRIFPEKVAKVAKLDLFKELNGKGSFSGSGINGSEMKITEKSIPGQSFAFPGIAYLEGLGEGAFTLSPENNILVCNKCFSHLMNRTEAELLGSKLGIFIEPGDVSKLDHFLKMPLSAKKTVDISILPVNGVMPVMIRISLNFLPGTDAGNNVFFIAFDISGFKKTENELKLAQSASEKRVAERTSKLMRANDDMVASRVATLSMMEDTVEAKNKLEDTNRKLLEEIIERKRSELIQNVLFRISNAVFITRDLEELISIIHTELGKLLDAKNFYIAFYDEVTHTLSTPYIEDEKDEVSNWPADKSLTYYVIKNGKKLLANEKDIKELIRLGEIELVGTPCKVWLGVPLEVDGKVLGAFVVQSYDDAKAYDIKDMEMLEFISHQISTAIQRKKAVQDLTVALAKAEESDRLKTAFLQNISHEIRTPMNAILGFSDLLNEPGLEASMRKTYTDIITQSGNHLLTILEDIINVSELEAGKEVMLSGKTSLNLLLRDLYEQYKLRAEKKNIELILSAPCKDEEVLIITDETKLIQIISNLLNNALKFTRQGSIHFGYTLKNRQLEFYVKDTGVGIPDDKYMAIFDRFKQVEIVLSRESGGRGLGLGLSICKAYVNLLGGSIWLKSDPGAGTVFYFSIPFIPAGTQKKSEDKIITDVVFDDKSRPKTILIAEEVKQNYFLVSKLFAGLHANIIWVSNGLDAVQTCKAVQQIDMLVMDLNMAKMDGFEAAKIIREFMPDLPIIAQSSIACKKELKKAILAGFCEYSIKPLEVSQVIAFTNKYLDNYFNIFSIQHLAS